MAKTRTTSNFGKARTLETRWDTRCDGCKKPLPKGTMVYYNPEEESGHGRILCLDCRSVNVDSKTAKATWNTFLAEHLDMARELEPVIQQHVDSGRAAEKIARFHVIYGGGATKLAAATGMTESEAQDYVRTYQRLQGLHAESTVRDEVAEAPKVERTVHAIRYTGPASSSGIDQVAALQQRVKHLELDLAQHSARLGMKDRQLASLREALEMHKRAKSELEKTIEEQKTIIQEGREESRQFLLDLRRLSIENDRMELEAHRYQVSSASKERMRIEHEKHANELRGKIARLELELLLAKGAVGRQTPRSPSVTLGPAKEHQAVANEQAAVANLHGENTHVGDCWCSRCRVGRMIEGKTQPSEVGPHNDKCQCGDCQDRRDGGRVYVIQNTNVTSADWGRFYRVEDGWVESVKDATRFTMDERENTVMPMCGTWVHHRWPDLRPAFCTGPQMKDACPDFIKWVMTDAVADQIRPVVRRYLMDQPVTEAMMRALADEVAKTYAPLLRGAPFKVICDDTNNKPEDKAKGMMHATLVLTRANFPDEVWDKLQKDLAALEQQATSPGQVGRPLTPEEQGSHE